MQKFPDYKEKLAASNRSVDKVIVIENQHYSTNHATVGSLLARNWGLPDYIGHAIRLHHDQTIFSHASEIATPTVCTLVSIQILSEHIVAISLKKPDDAEWFRMGKSAQDYIGISDEEMEDVTEDAIEELEKMRVLN